MMQSARIELRTAETADVPQLRRVWRESFGDEDAYLDLFFQNRFVPDNTPVLTRDGEIAAQLFLLPASLRAQGGRFPIDYLFAAATAPAYRRQGYMDCLLRFAADLAARRGKAAVVLCPGSEALYRYYEKRGYRMAFARRVWHCSRRTLQEAAAGPAAQADAVRTLAAYLQSTDGVVWDEDALRYALAEHRAFRGSYAAAGQAFASVSAETAQILAPADAVGQGCALLLGLSDAQRFTVTLPPDAPFGVRQDGGMICFMAEEIPLHDALLSFAME